MTWTPPTPTASDVPDWSLVLPIAERESVMKVTRIGLDMAKNVFEVHGVDEQGKVVLKMTLKNLVSGKPGRSCKTGESRYFHQRVRTHSLRAFSANLIKRGKVCNAPGASAVGVGRAKWKSRSVTGPLLSLGSAAARKVRTTREWPGRSKICSKFCNSICKR